MLESDASVRLPRIPKNLHDLADKLEYILPDDLKAVETASRTLTLADCYDLLGLIPDQVPAQDKLYIEACHRKGRAYAISYAGNQLFTQMVSPRHGLNASLEYLNAMSGTFAAEIDKKPSGSGFNFNVNLDPGTTKNQNSSSAKLKEVK